MSNPFAVKSLDPCPFGCRMGKVSRIDTSLDMFSCVSVGVSGQTLITWHGFPLWGAPTKDPHYPHECPKCKGPAYQGCTPGSKWDCKGKCGV